MMPHSDNMYMVGNFAIFTSFNTARLALPLCCLCSCLCGGYIRMCGNPEEALLTQVNLLYSPHLCRFIGWWYWMVSLRVWFRSKCQMLTFSLPIGWGLILILSMKAWNKTSANDFRKIRGGTLHAFLSPVFTMLVVASISLKTLARWNARRRIKHQPTTFHGWKP